MRAKLREDAEQDLLGEARVYVKFAMGHDDRMCLKAARRLVAREKRAVTRRLQVV